MGSRINNEHHLASVPEEASATHAFERSNHAAFLRGIEFQALLAYESREIILSGFDQARPGLGDALEQEASGEADAYDQPAELLIPVVGQRRRILQTRTNRLW